MLSAPLAEVVDGVPVIFVKEKLVPKMPQTPNYGFFFLNIYFRKFWWLK